MTKFVLFLSLPIALALGQSAPSPSSAETARKATIEGVVVNEITKEPLRRAEVSLQRSGKSGMMMGGDNSAYSAVTDASGRFRIGNIEPGEYFLNHHKTGYVGSRSAFGSSARFLKLGAGDSLTDLRYSLLPQAVVTGRVVDDEGEPVQGASVMLMRSSYRRGSGQMLTPAAQAITNDLGEYRIINVQPGRYYLQANIQRMMPGGGVPPSPSAPAGTPRTALVSTYYPSATESSQATRIEARAGLGLSGQDITLRREKVYKLSGKVLDANGSPARQTFVMLRVEDGDVAYGFMGSGVDEKGSFAINNTRPGQYTITASKMDGQNRQSAETSVTVGDSDVTSVVLQMLPGLEAKGSIVLEGSDKKDFDFSHYFINLIPTGSPPFGGAGAQAKADGTFTISQITPGRYNLGINNDGGEGYVQSIQLAGEDVYGKEVDADNLAVGGLRIVVRLDSAKVAGTVEIPDDRKAYLRSPSVLLVPADPRLRNSSRFNLAQLNQTNSFELKNLRPGDYLAFAFEEFDDGSISDPEVFTAIESKATAFSLARGESKDLALKLLPWPQQFADRLQ
jgi:protocatechuate 3,4-dioxygenase beta subunit